MATYEISVFITQELYEYGNNNYNDPYRARNRAATYLERGIEDYSSHYVTIVKGDKTPSAPREDVHGSFTGPCICDPFYDCTWDNLYDWWVDWYQYNCKDPHKEAQHTNLLLTAGSGLGRGGGAFAIAGSGQGICDLSQDYLSYGFDDSHHAMWVAMQEAGHSLQSGVDIPDYDDDGHRSNHDTGKVYQHSAHYTKSPMGVSNEANDCGEPSDPESVVNNGRELRYSTCTTDYFK
jgi:hypothetical protein